MEVNIPKGKYVLAVSGGVDSMVLLDLLAKMPSLELVIAHFNHGIRPDASDDEELVKQRAEGLGLLLKVGYGQLGAISSEEKARNARYLFLKRLAHSSGAKAIITAHHQDDLIETAILNLIRGTGRKGMTAISSNPEVIRPLISYPKSDIYKYAKTNKIAWREDITNKDETYLRNYIRKNITNGLTSSQRSNIINNIDKVAKLEAVINPRIAKMSHNIYKKNHINREEFTSLPIDLGNELIVYWLRQFQEVDIDKRTVSRLNLAIRTAKPGTSQPVKKNLKLKIGYKTAEFNRSAN
jgi:tRNA(Ile)-lysidine synthetase-like protein